MRAGSLLTLASLGATCHGHHIRISGNGLPRFLGDDDPIPAVEPILIPSTFDGETLADPFAKLDDSWPSKGHVSLSKGGDGCSPEPLGSGPSPSNDTADGFRSFQPFADAAGQSAVPEGYEIVMNGTALTASVASVSLQGVSIIDKYDPESCATICNKNSACIAFNIYFERDPTRTPDITGGCGDPPSTTNIKCVFWGNYLTGAMARNQGEMREHFEVAIAGSNIYNKKGYSSDLTPIGFKSTSSQAGVLVVPNEPVGRYNTFLGSKRFDYAEGWSFNPAICAHECNKQTEESSQKSLQPPVPFSTGSYPKCVMFQAFEVHRGGLPATMVCANYMSAWDPEAYATWTADLNSNGTRVEAKIAEVYVRTDYRFPPICAEKLSCAGRFYKGGDCSGWGADRCLFDAPQGPIPSAEATKLSEPLATGQLTLSTQDKTHTTLSQAPTTLSSTLSTQVRPLSTRSKSPSVVISPTLAVLATPLVTLPSTLLVETWTTSRASRPTSVAQGNSPTADVRTVVWEWITPSGDGGVTLQATQSGTSNGPLTTPATGSGNLVELNASAASSSPRLVTRRI